LNSSACFLVLTSMPSHGAWLQGYAVFECNPDESQRLRQLGRQLTPRFGDIAVAHPPQPPDGRMALPPRLAPIRDIGEHLDKRMRQWYHGIDLDPRVLGYAGGPTKRTTWNNTL
jgi:hypothetical protein